jgi:hypothetical protein
MILKKTLFKKNILALILSSYYHLTTGISLSHTQLLQTVLLAGGVITTNIIYNEASLALLSETGHRIFDHKKIICYEIIAMNKYK